MKENVMPVEIENMTNRPVLLRLNSGTTLHLAPLSTSSEIMDDEVVNNAKVQKLLDRRVIDQHEAGKKAISKPPEKGEVEIEIEKAEAEKKKGDAKKKKADAEKIKAEAKK